MLPLHRYVGGDANEHAHSDALGASCGKGGSQADDGRYPRTASTTNRRLEAIERCYPRPCGCFAGWQGQAVETRNFSSHLLRGRAKMMRRDAMERIFAACVGSAQLLVSCVWRLRGWRKK